MFSEDKMSCTVQPRLRPLNKLNWAEINPFHQCSKENISRCETDGEFEIPFGHQHR